MTYNITGRYGGFFRVLRYNVGGYGIPTTQNLSSGCVGMAGCHTLLHKFQSSQLNISTPQHLNISTPQHLNTSTSLNLVEALAEDTLAECLRNDGVGVDCLDYGEHFLRLVLTREDDE